MEAARDEWRPLGELLVEKGVISADELENALDEQHVSGLRLGEILIARGYASRPGIAEALAEQRGLVLEPERGFGTGLRDQLERRHREHRLHVVDEEEENRTSTRFEQSLDESLVATAAALGERDESDRLRGEVERLEQRLAEAVARIAELEAAVTQRADEAETLDATIARAREHLAERRHRLPERS